MKGRPVDQLVHEYMFPKPRTQDPQNFHALLQRHLILEIRQEVHSFYGHLDTPEAKYPGLDYCHAIHRIRLSRWPWHRRLFRAFDALRLTPNEIGGLTKWEGTKWAKERFEKEQGFTIHDTTADDFAPWVKPEDRVTPARGPEQVEADAEDDEDMANQDSDEELESVGVALNEQLLERVAAREAGDMTTPLDEAWEQWLKQAIESGQIDTRLSPEEIFPRRMLESARDGNWQEVPSFLHDMIRDSLETEQARVQELATGRRSAMTVSSTRDRNVMDGVVSLVDNRHARPTRVSEGGTSWGPDTALGPPTVSSAGLHRSFMTLDSGGHRLRAVTVTPRVQQTARPNA